MEWQPIETAPDDIIHTRGMWVYTTNLEGESIPAYFTVDTGYVNEDGDFVSADGDDCFGWSADDYDWWCPVPYPFPNPPE